MAGDRKYVRIPPESTGDRILLIHTQEVAFNNQTPGYVWKRGEEYTITGGGGVTISITLHEAIVNDDGITGFLVYEIDKRQNYIESPNPISGQVIREGGVAGTQVASVSGTPYCVYINGQTIVGAQNSAYAANVDRFGSLYTRFGEGAPQLSSFDSLHVNDAKLLAQYDFTKSALNSEFVNSQEGLGRKTWEPDIGAIKMTCSGDATTLDRVTSTSNIWHPFVPGSGILFVFAARADSVNTGVIRNWGAFDATDGYFFQQNGTKLRVVHRYTLDGAATANMVMDQSVWNRDTLDGSGSTANPSGMNLDITKINLYWVDYQFHGGGRVRWGVFFNGERIVCHEMRHGNGEEGNVTLSNPIGNPNRPLCWAITNRTDADSNTPNGSQSNFWAMGGAVYLESSADPLKESNIASYKNNSFTIPATSTSTEYAFTLSPAQYYPEALAQSTLGGGSYTLSGAQLENHTIYAPISLDVSAYDSTNDNDVKVEVRLFQKCIMRGLNYNNVSYTTVEVDTDGDHLAHGPEFARFVVDGNKTYDFTTIFETIQNGAVKNNSDQAFARAFQPLALFSEAADPEGTGVNRVVIKVKDHPIFGSNIHFFDDKSPVVLRDPDNLISTSVLAGFADQGNLKTTDGDWYYLSFIDRDDAWLYTSTADIDNDRQPRQLTLAANTAAINVGDKIIFDYPGNNTANCVVLSVANTTSVLVEARSTTDIDIGMKVVAANTFTVGIGGSVTGSVSAVANTSGYPLDYKTSLLAVQKSDLGTFDIDGGTSDTLADTNALYGPPPAKAAWTFMVRHLSTKSNDTRTRWSMNWKERQQ